MKKAVRGFLAILCLVYLILFVKDWESVQAYADLSFEGHEPSYWIWLFYSYGLMLVSLALATVYAFSKRLWKRRWLLAASVAVIGIFLAFSGYLHVKEDYAALHPVATLSAVGIYIACIYATKFSFRRYIACAVLGVLTVALCIACAVSAGFESLGSWMLRYTMPLQPLALLGLILPEKYD